MLNASFIRSRLTQVMGLLLGAIASLLCSVGTADAAETVILNYLDTRIPVSNQEFVGQIVRTHSGKANIQALRSALILSARDDNQITFLEFLQNYPLPQMYVDGMRLAKLARLAKTSGGGRGLAVSEAQSLEDFLVNVQAAIAKEVCNCENKPA